MIVRSLKAIVRSFALWSGSGRCANSVSDPLFLTESRFVRKGALLFAALLLASCGDGRPVISTPPIEWTEPVALPTVPEGEAVCDGQPCLSDHETGSLIADLAKALDTANARLLKLRDWIRAAGE